MAKQEYNKEKKNEIKRLMHATAFLHATNEHKLLKDVHELTHHKKPVKFIGKHKD